MQLLINGIIDNISTGEVIKKIEVVLVTYGDRSDYVLGGLSVCDTVAVESNFYKVLQRGVDDFQINQFWNPEYPAKKGKGAIIEFPIAKLMYFYIPFVRITKLTNDLHEVQGDWEMHSRRLMFSYASDPVFSTNGSVSIGDSKYISIWTSAGTGSIGGVNGKSGGGVTIVCSDVGALSISAAGGGVRPNGIPPTPSICTFPNVFTSYPSESACFSDGGVAYSPKKCVIPAYDDFNLNTPELCAAAGAIYVPARCIPTPVLVDEDIDDSEWCAVEGGTWNDTTNECYFTNPDYYNNNPEECVLMGSEFIPAHGHFDEVPVSYDGTEESCSLAGGTFSTSQCVFPVNESNAYATEEDCLLAGGLHYTPETEGVYTRNPNGTNGQISSTADNFVLIGYSYSGDDASVLGKYGGSDGGRGILCLFKYNPNVLAGNVVQTSTFTISIFGNARVNISDRVHGALNGI